MIRFFFLFTFLSCSFSLQSQSVKKAFKLYEKRDLLKFEETLEKMDEKSIESSGKYFLYSLLYLENLDSRSSIDSSYLLINKSKEIYPNEFSKEREELEELGINLLSIDSIIAVIDSIEFDFVKAVNTIIEYKKYMIDHKESKFYDQSKKNWHTLEFKIVSNINTWQAYEEFMNEFPNANDFSLAKSLYEELLFKEKTSDRSLMSFEKFLNDNPKTPYRDSLEFMIFKYYGLSNNVDNLKQFVEKYPESKFITEAVNIIYHSSDRDLLSLKNLELNKTLEDSLKSISKIDKEKLFGVYEEDEIYFINASGEKLINEVNNLISSDVLCSFSESDFFIINDDEKFIIINREFKNIYSGNRANYIEDIGKGLIKILYDKRVEVIHKSGKLIFSGDFNDAYLVDDRFILFEKESKYSLYTFNGDRIFDLIFYDAFQEGPFILFENEEGKLYVTTSDRLEEEILNLSAQANFTYDDFEYFEDGNILLFSENKEELLNSKMEHVISPDNQLIEKYPFGWTATSDFGIRIISNKLSIPFTVLYDKLISTEKYFIGKRNQYWEVRNISNDSIILQNIDSVRRVTDSVFWYRNDINEALYFSNSNQLIFEENYNFKLLSSKFGSKKYIKIIREDEQYIVDLLGKRLPAAEYYYTVEKGNTFSFLSEKFKISQSELMKMNKKKNKRLFVGEKLKVRGYVPSAIISDSLFLIEFNGKKGISDTDGKIILEPEYDGITNLSKDNIILIKDEKFGNFNSSSKKLIFPKYSSVLNPIGENHFKVNSNNLYGIIDTNGEQILSGIYDDIRYLNDSLFILIKEKKYTLFDVLNSDNLIEFENYSFTGNGSNNFILIQTEEGFGVFSVSHGEILMPVYNSIKTLDLDGAVYFLAKREISEANLIINLLVDEKGNIILNQALNFNDLSIIFCD